MPKLPEFNSKPIKGLKEEDWSKLTIKHDMDIEKLKYALDKWTGSKHSKESKKIMSEKKKGKVAFACTNPESRAKAGKTNSKGLKAYTYPEMKFVGEYLNTKEAGKALNMHPNMIAGVARGVHKQVRGYTFSYIKSD